MPDPPAAPLRFVYGVGTGGRRVCSDRFGSQSCSPHFPGIHGQILSFYDNADRMENILLKGGGNLLVFATTVSMNPPSRVSESLCHCPKCCLYHT